MARGAPPMWWLRSAAAALPLLLAMSATAPSASFALSPPAPDALQAQAHHNAAKGATSTASGQHRFPDMEPHALRSPIEGVVTSVASVEAQAEFSAAEGAWADSRRALLHGKRRPRSYTICPICTPITCNTGTATCSGHCKRSRTLFTCKTDGRVAPGCGENDDLKPDPATVPPDSITGVGSAWVTVTAPYVGCANVSNAADGCPDPGTTGTLNGEGVTVLESTCTQHLYKLPCATKRSPSPFYPFGYCFCLLKFDSGKVAGGPCRLPYLDWSGPAGGEDDVPVRVIPEGDVTRTTFAETEESDARRYTLKHTFASSEGRIDAELWIFESRLQEGFDIVAEGPLEEREEEGQGGENEEGEDGEQEDEEGEGGENVEEEEEVEEESALGKFLRGFSPE